MARRLDYLQEEVRVLREALALASGKKRIEATADQRRRPAKGWGYTKIRDALSATAFISQT
ncbi:MAG: hypothetical protein ABI548_09955 [Polyangiaceae bacterium]